MPKLDGFGVARELRRLSIATPLVFLTLHDAEDLLDTALDLGARGYLLKSGAMTEIVEGLRAVAAGRHFVSAALTGQLLGRRQAAPAAGTIPGLDTLTPAERRVLRLIGQYKSNKAIAAELFVHHRTIESHRANISQKLDLHGHNALLRFALDHNRDL
jgi:DNA-binding NarL/FixJ family response regulator